MNNQDDNNPFGSGVSGGSPFGASGNDSPFGASGNDNPFGSTGSPFGASGNDNPFGATGNDDNPLGVPPAPVDPFAIGNSFGDAPPPPQAPAHVVPNPFGAAAPAAADPFGAGAPPAHVVPNPFGAATAAHAPEDPFAIGNDASEPAAAPPAHVVPNPFGAAPADPFAIGNDADPPAHMLANPFGAGGPFGVPAAPAPAAAAARPQDPFAFGNNNDPPPADGGGLFAGFGAAVANLNPFGGGGANNPFGIANHEDAALDLSQHSLGETFLAGHMNRIAQETSMRLSDEERRWAKELKAAVEASKDIKKEMNDFDIAQQAITNQGHVMNALLSIKALQEFCMMYEIDDTPEQGIQCLRALFDQQEGMFLEIDTNPQTQETSIVVDVREYDPSKSLAIVEGKPAGHSWQVLARGYYYLYRTATPSLASIRHGLFLVVDCDGVGWDNFNHEVDQRIHAELIQHLPLNYKRTMAYGTAMISNIWWGLTKRLWKEKFQNVLELGCRLVDTDPSRPPRRLAEMYRQPDLATVRRKMERQAVEMMNTRENNEHEFRLQSQQEEATATASSS